MSCSRPLKPISGLCERYAQQIYKKILNVALCCKKNKIKFELGPAKGLAILSRVAAPNEYHSTTQSNVNVLMRLPLG